MASTASAGADTAAATTKKRKRPTGKEKAARQAAKAAGKPAPTRTGKKPRAQKDKAEADAAVDDDDEAGVSGGGGGEDDEGGEDAAAGGDDDESVWSSVPIHPNLYLRGDDSLAGLISLESVPGDVYAMQHKQSARDKRNPLPAADARKRRAKEWAAAEQKRIADARKLKKEQQQKKAAKSEPADGTPGVKLEAGAAGVTKKEGKESKGVKREPTAVGAGATTVKREMPADEAAAKRMAKKHAERERKKLRKEQAKAVPLPPRVKPAPEVVEDEGEEEKKAGGDAKAEAKENGEGEGEGENAEMTGEGKEEKTGEGGDLLLSSASASDDVKAAWASDDAWEAMGLHPLLLDGVKALGFKRPTPIQAACLPGAVRDWRDIVAAAATGSGKTLAFGMPIVHHVMEIMDRRQEKRAERAMKNSWKAKTDEQLEQEKQRDEAEEKADKALLALILCPTRELALQVTDHINAVAKFTPVKAVPVVGGLALPKQARLLASKPQIVVSTPGRLWELITEGQPHLCDMSHLRFFVLDEADRMVSNGHFPQLNKIIHYMETYKDREATRESEEFFADLPVPGKPLPPSLPLDYDATQGEDDDSTVLAGQEEQEEQEEDGEGEEKQPDSGINEDDEDEEDDEEENGDERVKKEESKGVKKEETTTAAAGGEEKSEKQLKKERRAEAKAARIEGRRAKKAEAREARAAEARETGVGEATAAAAQRRQTFLFSATLMLPEQGREEDKKKKKKAAKKRKGPESTMLDELAGRLSFRDDPLIVDLSTAHQVAEGLDERRVDCVDSDKDYYLHYFLSRNPGKTLVFVNAISCLRRVVAIFTLLGFPVFGLHANMQQRQRLKNLDRFKANPKAIAVCTDVAARGLDIKGVQFVVHYQLPRSSEIYIHRAGRTARAGKTGLSLVLVGPSDQRSYKRICHVLKKEKGIPLLEMEDGYMELIQDRVKLARRVDFAQNALNKQHANSAWFRRQAMEAGLDLDDNTIRGQRLLITDTQPKKKKGKKGRGGDDEDEEMERDWDDVPEDDGGGDDGGGGGGGGASGKAPKKKSKAARRAALEQEEASELVGEARREQSRVDALRAQLRAMTSQPLVPRGIARSFFTRNSHIPLATSNDNGTTAIDLTNIGR